MILMKNAIITYSDAKYGDFLIDHWLRSLKLTNDLKNIDVIVIDYGLTKEQSDKLKKENVLVFKFKKDGFPSCIRFRDMLKVLDKREYDQVMTTDGGDIIFQSDINILFKEDNKDYRGVCEIFSPPFEKLFMLAFDKADADKMKKVVTGKRLVNAGMILAPYNKFISLCEECDSLIKKRVFGPDMITVNYIFYRDGFKELQSKYNFIITTSKEDFYVKDNFFYLANGTIIPIVHNAGGKDFFRPVINFGYGKGFNTKRRSFFLIKGIVKAMHSTGKMHDKITVNKKSSLIKNISASKTKRYIIYSPRNISKMKICLYHESGKLLSVSGIGNAFTNIEKAVKSNKISYTKDPKDDYDILHLNFIGVQSLRLALQAKMEKKKVVIHTHMTKEDFMNSFFMSNLIATEVKFLLNNFYSLGDCLISPSTYTKGIIRSYGIKNRIEIVSNGVDTEKYRPSAKKARIFKKKYHITKPSVFSVGIPFKRKGIYDFIEISKGFPELDFYWVGKKFNRMVMPDSSKAFEVESKNMQFTGFVDDIIGAYSAGDIFLFPSYEENQGIVILEAASMGKPILVRDIPVYKDWLFHGENCLKAKSNAEFVRNIQKVMDDKKLRNKLIKGSLKLAKENDLKIVGKRYKAIYQSLMASKK